MNRVANPAKIEPSSKCRQIVLLVAASMAMALPTFLVAQQIGSQPAVSAPAATVLDAAKRKAVVDVLAQKLISDYAYAEVGAKLAAAVQANLKAKSYDGITGNEAFAKKLTDDLYAVAKDKHLRVNYDARPMPVMQEGIPPEAIAQLRKQNGAIPKVEILEGNVGYMRVNGVPPFDYSKDAVATAFAFLKNTDALIIDNRGNGGGDPRTVAWYMSYLSEGEPYLLNTFRWRNGGRFEESRTTNLGELAYGKQKPVYVLTSPQTFSGGEELTYNLQAFKRGVVVGETTGGGANPGGVLPLGNQFVAFIPSGYPVNAITQSNWEGVGVKPDVAVNATQALDKAYVLALDKLSAGLTDVRQRRPLEAVALKVKLNSEGNSNVALLPNAQVVGDYLDSASGRVLVTVSEKDGALSVRLPSGIDQRLELVSGNRYKMQLNGAVTFIKEGSGLKALVELPVGATVLTDKR
ncbi:MAG: S41 family peptidase [Steroidobacteraceae bacterium]